MSTEPIGDCMDDLILTWYRRNDVIVPSALLCAEPHPLAPECLCRRLGGHRGGHTFDGLPDWAEAREEPPHPRAGGWIT